MLHIRFIDEHPKRRLAFDIDGGLEYATRRTLSPLTVWHDHVQAVEVCDGTAKLYCPSGSVLQVLKNGEQRELRKRLTLLFPMLED
jgi:hypothetical protein